MLLLTERSITCHLVFVLKRWAVSQRRWFFGEPRCQLSALRHFPPLPTTKFPSKSSFSLGRAPSRVTTFDSASSGLQVSLLHPGGWLRSKSSFPSAPIAL